jgi:7-cyano-7-deazaguanine reductase
MVAGFGGRIRGGHICPNTPTSTPDPGSTRSWPNQYPDYEITVEIPEYNAICPKTGLPDFGHLTIRYVPDRLCLELKSLKLYVVAYRNVGIFYENAVNRILEDCVAACRPVRMTITGTFSSRGGISSTIEVRYPRG